MTNKSSVSMRPRLAADDVEIKFSELAIGGVEPRYCTLRAFASSARFLGIPNPLASILTWATL